MAPRSSVSRSLQVFAGVATATVLVVTLLTAWTGEPPPVRPWVASPPAVRPWVAPDYDSRLRVYTHWRARVGYQLEPPQPADMPTYDIPLPQFNETTEADYFRGACAIKVNFRGGEFCETAPKHWGTCPPDRRPVIVAGSDQHSCVAVVRKFLGGTGPPRDVLFIGDSVMDRLMQAFRRAVRYVHRTSRAIQEGLGRCHNLQYMGFRNATNWHFPPGFRGNPWNDGRFSYRNHGCTAMSSSSAQAHRFGAPRKRSDGVGAFTGAFEFIPGESVADVALQTDDHPTTADTTAAYLKRVGRRRDVCLLNPALHDIDFDAKFYGESARALWERYLAAGCDRVIWLGAQRCTDFLETTQLKAHAEVRSAVAQRWRAGHRDVFLIETFEASRRAPQVDAKHKSPEFYDFVARMLL
jgi:hypothetical protein